MNAFSQAYDRLGPDTLAIAEAIGIPEHEADHLINERMDKRHANKIAWQRRKQELAELRRGRAA